MVTAIISCAFGIYIGRFMRFNSWDVVKHWEVLFHQLAARVLNPIAHPPDLGFYSFVYCDVMVGLRDNEKTLHTRDFFS